MSLQVQPEKPAEPPSRGFWDNLTASVVDQDDVKRVNMLKGAWRGWGMLLPALHYVPKGGRGTYRN
ncbi:hypothetical protein T484DRAFT_1883649 [Baffinella frigidus]|nr:hypothetical protein T484DRAFT_1883649 [Cryptophyta sp. CCMP2293]